MKSNQAADLLINCGVNLHFNLEAFRNFNVEVHVWVDVNLLSMSWNVVPSPCLVRAMDEA